MTSSKNQKELHRILMCNRIKKVLLHVNRGMEYLQKVEITKYEDYEASLMVTSALDSLTDVMMQMGTLEIKLKNKVRY